MPQLQQLTFRIAATTDLPTIIEIAGLGREDASDHIRRLSLEQRVLELRCWLALDEDRAVGFGLITHTFFGRPFIELLVVHPEHRRGGVGRALLHHVTAAAAVRGGSGGVKVFTSTNQSNIAMQQLLEAEGFAPSGVVHNLDEGDPELIYVKLWPHWT